MNIPSNWKNDFYQIWNHSGGRIIGSVSIGIILAIVQYFLNDKNLDSDDLMISTIASILVYLGFIFKDTNELYKLRNRLGQADSSYKELIDSHLELPHSYPNFIDKRLLNDIHTKKGLIFINVDDRNYREWLNECGDKAKLSFCATLTDSYMPSFFFKEDNSGALTYKSKKNIEYLDKTNKISVTEDRIRIFIYKKATFIKDLNSLKEEYLKTFFKVQNNFRLYFIDPDEIRNEFDSRRHSFIEAAISSDFAMFDNSLVFRRVGNVELAYYFTKDMNNITPNPFAQLFCPEMLQDDCFHSLDKIKKYVIDGKSKNEIIKELESLTTL